MIITQPEINNPHFGILYENISKSLMMDTVQMEYKPASISILLCHSPRNGCAGPPKCLSPNRNLWVTNQTGRIPPLYFFAKNCTERGDTNPANLTHEKLYLAVALSLQRWFDLHTLIKLFFCGHIFERQKM